MPGYGVITSSEPGNKDTLISLAAAWYCRALRKKMKRIDMNKYVYGPLAEKYKDVQTQEDVVSFLKSKSRTIRTKGIQMKDAKYVAKHIRHGYSNQLFVHKINPTLDHSLKSHKTKKEKSENRGQLCEIEKVLEQISIDISNHSMFYCFKGFHARPHGSIPWTDRRTSEKRLREEGNLGSGSIIHHIRLDDVVNKEHKCVRVCYPGSHELKSFSFFDESKRHELLQFVIDNGKRQSGKRDDGFAKRWTTGYTQKQGEFNAKTRYIDGVQIPLINTDKLENMSRSLKLCIAKILETSQTTLLQLYNNEDPPPFFSTKRNTEVGKVFTECFSESSTSYWEFLDCFIEKQSRLNRHLDYLNGAAIGYDYGCSFSYVIKHDDGDVYRVNLIMCNRQRVDCCFGNGQGLIKY